LGKWWYLLTWQDEFVERRRIRKRKRIKLAPATLLEREVRKIAAEVLRPMNQGLVTVGSALAVINGHVQRTHPPLICAKSGPYTFAAPLRRALLGFDLDQRRYLDTTAHFQ